MSNGTLLVKDPVSGKTSNFDPSTIQGFIGDFKCSSLSNNCQIYSVGKSDTGDFTYDYQANTAILAAAGMKANTSTNSTKLKLRVLREL